MQISFKRQRVAWWVLSAALVGIAGCGGGTSPQKPVASADAGEILFVVARAVPGDGTRDSPPDDRSLFLASLDGSNRTLIPTNAVREPDHPAWLLGRRELVYADSFSGRGGVTSSIRRVGRDGSGDREIIPAQPGVLVVDLAVSADGRRLAYSTAFSLGIFVAGSDGTGTVRLTAGFSPSWSPDGRRLVFCDFVGEQLELFTIGADGSNRTRLTNTPESEDVPQWSPNGRRIVYTRVPLDGTTNVNIQEQEIFTIGVDGSNSNQITNNAEPSFAPHWTPDGRRIVFTSNRSGNDLAFFIMNADGSNQVRLASFPGEASNLDLALR